MIPMFDDVDGDDFGGDDDDDTAVDNEAGDDDDDDDDDDDNCSLHNHTCFVVAIRVFVIAVREVSTYSMI